MDRSRSHVYLLILGGRYGSIELISGKSYIQLEYEYAIGRNMPFFACVIESALDQRVRALGATAIETANGQKMKEFGDSVLTKMVKLWNDPRGHKNRGRRDVVSLFTEGGHRWLGAARTGSKRSRSCR